MDEILAQLYGTEETIKEAALDEGETEDELVADMYKVAADAFVDTANEQGIDLEKLSEEDVENLFADFSEGFFKAAAEAEEMEDEEEEKKKKMPEEEKEAELQEKIAEADTLGRLMAHAYVNELVGMNKEAKGLGSAVKGVAREYADVMRGKGTQAAKKKLQEEIASFSKTRGGSAPTPTIDALKRQLRKARGERAATIGTTAAGGLGAAGAAGGGIAAGVKKSKEKKAAEEYNELVLARAYDLLKQAGYEVEEAPEVDEDVEKLATDIERDALTLLEHNGYPVQWAEDAE